MQLARIRHPLVDQDQAFGINLRLKKNLPRDINQRRDTARDGINRELSRLSDEDNLWPPNCKLLKADRRRQHGA